MFLVFFFLYYHAASDSIVMLGAEVTSVWRDDRASSINLLRVDLKSNTLNVTNLCSVTCYIDDTLLKVRDDKIIVIKYTDGERHLYELTLHEPTTEPTTAPSGYPINVVLVVVLVALALVLAVAVAAVAAIIWFRKRKQNKISEPYAEMQEL